MRRRKSLWGSTHKIPPKKAPIPANKKDSKRFFSIPARRYTPKRRKGRVFPGKREEKRGKEGEKEVRKV
jgi:hypothetical protein